MYNADIITKPFSAKFTPEKAQPRLHAKSVKPAKAQTTMPNFRHYRRISEARTNDLDSSCQAFLRCEYCWKVVHRVHKKGASYRSESYMRF